MSLDLIAYRMAMHLIGVHCNAAAIGTRSFSDLSDAHEHEHFGPGGLRHHLYTDLSFDETKVEDVLEEAERYELLGALAAEAERADAELGPARPRLWPAWADRYPQPEPAAQHCPDNGVCGHFCARGHCFRVMACSPFTGYYPDEPDGRWPVDVEVAEMTGTLENYS